MARDLIEGEFDFKFVSVPIRGLFFYPVELEAEKEQKATKVSVPIRGLFFYPKEIEDKTKAYETVSVPIRGLFFYL